MAIKPHFEYSSKKDMIVGFVDNGKKRVKRIADHALVFMIRGITKNYKQPISYTFCCTATEKHELAQAIKDHIRKLKSSGFHVIATVCDQGSSNMSAINALIAETKHRNTHSTRYVFEVDGDEVIPLYDPPHLIKNIRNNLMTKNLTCSIDNENKTAKWEHIVKLYEENPAYKGIRLMPKLTELHVDPKKMPKMKVKYATQLLSSSVAVNMGYLAEKGILDPSSKETADVILFFDELFDSVNGGFMNEKKRPGKDLLGPLTPKSSHQSVWTKSKEVLKTMKFVTPQGHRKSHVSTVPNWLRTLENLEYLKDLLFQKHEIKSIWLRHFNQDPLENFFGCVRSHGARSNNPTCVHFEVAFAALLINNLNSLHSPGYNCEKDQGRGFNCLSFSYITGVRTRINY
ncbi:uncharacterized protein LOC133528306 [Cydia pomonella]|uniref:uncharacterized protein LOC133528306 n=1 Tax=Cydia pomonella TaxID=82600 RepID=UPI002ADE8626|nr:uncharacterized protein LOC133528306 [Cydia pomonella]